MIPPEVRAGFAEIRARLREMRGHAKQALVAWALIVGVLVFYGLVGWGVLVLLFALLK